MSNLCCFLLTVSIVAHTHNNGVCYNRKYADMHFIYGMCHGNGAAAAEEYRQPYANSENLVMIIMMVETEMLILKMTSQMK